MARVVTVFGGSGFIGRQVVQQLAKEGWTIRVAVRRPSQAEFLQPLGDVGQITSLRARIQEPDAVRAAIEGADAVVNLVGLLYERGAQNFAAVHHDGAAGIARAAALAGVKSLVQMSAIGAHPKAEAGLCPDQGCRRGGGPRGLPGRNHRAAKHRFRARRLLF